MAEKLQKYKYTPKACRPTTAMRPHSPEYLDQALSRQSPNSGMSIKKMKEDIHSSLTREISKIIKDEVRSVLEDDFNAVKSKFHAMRADITINIATIRRGHNKSRHDRCEKLTFFMVRLGSDAARCRQCPPESNVNTMSNRLRGHGWANVAGQHTDRWHSRGTGIKFTGIGFKNR